MLLNRLCIMNWLKMLPLKLVNLLTKQIMMLRSKILRIKIPSITNSANPAALNRVGNKIPNVSNIVKKQIMMLRSMKLMVKYPTLMI